VVSNPNILPFSLPELLVVWSCLLLVGLYLGLFRTVVDRLRAGVACLPDSSSRFVSLLQHMLQAPNYARPLHVESALISSLQCIFGCLLFFQVFPAMGIFSLLACFACAFLMERFFSGIFPRLLACNRNFEMHLRIGYPLTILAQVLAWPFSKILSQFESVFGESASPGDTYQEEENEVADHIRTLAREGSNLDPDVAEIVGNTLEMGQLKVKDIMISRKQVQILDDAENLEKNLEIARTCGHTRLPLCEGDLDHCLGIIHVKYAFRLLGKNPDTFSLRSIIKAPAQVSPEDPLPVALRKMMGWKVHMALVGDEFGGIDGVITLEDILEEVVGEIQDEFDADEADIEKLNDKSWKISGLTPLHELPEELGIDEDDEEVASFGGLITQEFGKIPLPKEVLHLGDLEITILEADETRIGMTAVRLTEKASKNPKSENT